MERPAEHPGTLRFRSAELEEAYRLENTGRMARYVRWPLMLGAVLFGSYGFVDQAIAPDHAGLLWSIRLATTALIAGVVWRMTRRVGRGEIEALFSLVAIAAGAGLLVETWYWADAGRMTAHTGLIILLIYIHVLSRMPFVLVSVLGWAITLPYLVVLHLHPASTTLDVAEHAAALASANLTGMVASYVLERYSRRVFYQSREVAASNAALESQARTLRETNEYLASAIRDLQQAQERLVQQEKLASLGRLTAGVAHEIKNPLNFINNFAALNGELLSELRGALASDDAVADAEVLVGQLETNAERIVAHGRRADGIVRGMLAHSRAEPGTFEKADLNALVAEHADLAYHAFRASVPAARPTLSRDLADDVGRLAVDAQEMGRVVVNLVTNALQSVADRAATEGAPYAAAVTVSTRRRPDAVEIRVADNGGGVRPEARPRLFEPFFTTRPPGEGTGLGLSLSYEIAARHGGSIDVESEPGAGATFVVTLPRGGA